MPRLSAGMAALVLVLGGLIHGGAWAQEAEQPIAEVSQQTTEQATEAAAHEAAGLCPVSGEPIDRSIFTYFRDRRVYFNSQESREKFKSRPRAYLKEVEAQWKTLKPLRVQVRCPVTGKPPDRRCYVQWRAGRVCLVDDDAKMVWQKWDRPTRRKELRDCYTFQTWCPCGKAEIDPACYVQHGERVVYFCCPDCRQAFQEQPGKYLKGIDVQIKANEETWKKRVAAKDAERKQSGQRKKPPRKKDAKEE